MLFSAMVPDGTSKLGFCLGNTVPQAPDLIIRQAFHEKRDKLSAGQSQVTSISNFLTGCAPSSPSRSLPTPQFAAVPHFSSYVRFSIAGLGAVCDATIVAIRVGCERLANRLGHAASLADS